MQDQPELAHALLNKPLVQAPEPGALHAASAAWAVGPAARARVLDPDQPRELR